MVVLKFISDLMPEHLFLFAWCFCIDIKAERLVIHLAPSPQDDLTHLWAHKLFQLSFTWNTTEKCTWRRTGMKSLLFLVQCIAQSSKGEINEWILFSEICPHCVSAHFKTVSTSIFKDSNKYNNSKIIMGLIVSNDESLIYFLMFSFFV